MRLLHTSDWHLGRSFHDVGLLDAQAEYMDHLVEVVRSERVDAVVVAGDIYDRALPAPDTVSLLSETLGRLVDAGTRVVLSSGNHDSATRLGFAAGLLDRAGVHIRTSLADIGRPVVIDDVAIHALPYLEPSVAAGPMGATERTHAGVLGAATSRVRAALADHRGPSVVMAHAFVVGGLGCDSERDITVGGVAAVPRSVFDGFDYVALGHLHGAQQVDPRIRYSGSPVAMSFSETAHVKGSLLVELDRRSRVPSVTVVEAPVQRPLAVLRGELADLLADPQLSSAQGSWCSVTLTDAVRPLGAMDRVRARFPHTVELRFDPPPILGQQRSYAARLAAPVDDLDVCCDFLSHVRGGAAASPAERDLLAEAVEGARLRRGLRDDEGRVSAPAAQESVA